jgi:formylglycine-generating enzyme required for sulfatase activity
MAAVLFHPETSIRRALILALGTYGTEGLFPGEREPLIGKLLGIYQEDPDNGIHGAAAWTLRKWGQQAKLKEVDAQLAKVKNRGERRWFINGQGQTFAVIDGPIKFLMGSPQTEPDRRADEIIHHPIIRLRFAIATQEVSVKQYQEFVKENPRVDHAGIYSYTDPERPVSAVDRYDAVAYCNWLSHREWLPECYEPNQDGKYADGMKLKPDALSLGGYRLPTDAEWEYACRAGVETSRYYGTSVDLLGRYAWYYGASENHAQPCGSLLPNEFGLFDMLGNVDEWCLAYPSMTGIDVDAIGLYLFRTRSPGLLRGGSFYDLPALVRSARRFWSTPARRDARQGFRPVRTVP